MRIQLCYAAVVYAHWWPLDGAGGHRADVTLIVLVRVAQRIDH